MVSVSHFQVLVYDVIVSGKKLFTHVQLSCLGEN